MKLRICMGLFSAVFPLFSATSTTWEVNGYSELLKGRLSGLSLSADGMLAVGPAVRFKTPLEQPALWSLAVDSKGTVFAATGHQGKVYEVQKGGQSSVVWSGKQAEVFAICVDHNDRLYAGSSPNGGVYRIENGKGTEIWHSPAKYIWQILPGPNGSLFVSTGEPGRVYRIDSGGKAEVYYDTGQVNVTAMAMGPGGHLYAGTDPNGLLYDIAGAGSATVLYDSSLPEIRSIAVSTDGTVFAAAMGGAVATRAGTAQAASAATATVVTASAPTVITVTEAHDGQASGGPPAQAAQPQASGGVSSGIASAVGTSGAVEVTGVERSAIYKISPQGVIQVIRSSKEDNVYDLLLDGEGIVFSTDVHGRIFRLEGNKTTLLAELADGETTRILKVGTTLFAGMSNPARMFGLDLTEGGPGSYESQVHDSVSVAKWGHIQWRSGGPGLALMTRTGYSARPDGTWSGWSDPVSSPDVALIQSPAGRFIQWRAQWLAGSTARLDTVVVPYLPQNTPPAIHSITVSSVVGTNGAKAAATTTASSSAYSITVTDTGEAPAASSGTVASQTVSRLQVTQAQISWQADDADNDKLAYSVYFRPEDGTEWQLIRSRMFENTLLTDPDVFADGRYYFRVVASDAPSNSPEYARQAEMISTAVLMDSTPPSVNIGPPKRNGASLDIEVEGADKISPLRLCEYSLDAGSWQPIEAEDGVTDSPREKFRLHLDKLRPGEHLLVFRIYDAANNAGLGRVLIH